MGFKLTAPFAIGDPSGGMACKATWDGEGSSGASLKISNHNNQYTYGVAYTTDLAKPSIDWTPAVIYDGATRRSTPLQLQLGMPVYFFPWFQTAPLQPTRYSNIITDETMNASATSSDNSSAGIMITIMGSGGGGPDDQA